jgi:hypothetical protein
MNIVILSFVLISTVIFKFSLPQRNTSETDIREIFITLWD